LSDQNAETGKPGDQQEERGRLGDRRRSKGSDNLARIIDTKGHCSQTAWEIEGIERAVQVDKAMLARSAVNILSHDLAEIVDAGGSGR